MSRLSSDPDLLARCERAEAEGFFSLITDLAEEGRDAMGVSTTRVAGAPVWSCAHNRRPLFNRALGFGLYEPVAACDLDAVANFFGDQTHGIELSPIAVGLGDDELLRRGYMKGLSKPKFVRSSEPLQLPEGVRVELADPTQATTFANIMVSSFGFPDSMRTWVDAVVATSIPSRYPVLAYVRGEPAGSGFLCVHERVGWLGGGACLPKFRGRGVQRALIEFRSRLARDSGAEWITTETNPDTHDDPGYSYRNMIRSGFEMCFERPLFTFSASA